MLQYLIHYLNANANAKEDSYLTDIQGTFIQLKRNSENHEALYHEGNISKFITLLEEAFRHEILYTFKVNLLQILKMSNEIEK